MIRTPKRYLAHEEALFYYTPHYKKVIVVVFHCVFLLFAELAIVVQRCGLAARVVSNA